MDGKELKDSKDLVAYILELDTRLEARLRTVSERQQSLEESLKIWVTTEVHKDREDRKNFQEVHEAREWENRNMIEDLCERLLVAEQQLSQLAQQLRHPLGEMGRRLSQGLDG